MTGKRIALGLITTACAGMLVLSGCAASPGGEQAAMPMDAAPMAPAAVEAAPADKGAQIGPQIITTAWVTMRVDSVASDADRVTALAAASDGTVQQQDLTTSDGTQTATITVRIPADALEPFLADVEALGSVESVSRQASDVTQQRVDLDARIGALTASVTRLRQLLDQTATVADLVAVETELANRQAELDALTAQRDYLADQVAMSTVTITLLPTVRAGGVQAPGFLTGLQNGIAALGAALGMAITAAGFLAPFLVIVIVIAGPIVWILIRRRRRAG